MCNYHCSNEYSRCENYQLENKSMFSHCRLEFNEKYELRRPDHYSFIFMLTGRLRMKGERVDRIAEENNIYSLGFDVTMTLESLSDASFLILGFDDPNVLCNKMEMVGLEH